MNQVRTLLLAQGSALETVDGLSYQDYQCLYESLSKGHWGPVKDYSIAYRSYVQLHLIEQRLLETVSQGKYQAKQPDAFHKVYPEMDKFITFDQGEMIREQQQQEELSRKAAMQMLSADAKGAPQWLKDSMNG